MHLQVPEEYRSLPAAVPKPLPEPEQTKPRLPERTPSPVKLEQTTPPPVAQTAAPPEPRIKPEPRRFQLPPRTKATPVPQTLVLDTVPPETVLPAPVPLPTLLVWTPPKLRAPVKQFSVPRPKVPATQQSLPAAPVLEAPNREIVLGTVNMAPTLLNDSSRLIRIPTTSVPVSSAGQEPAKESPQIGPTASDQSPGVNVISEPNGARRSADGGVLPTANQVAQEDRAGGGSEGGSTPSKSGAPGPLAPGPNASGSPPGSGAGAAAPNGPAVDRGGGTGIQTIAGVTRISRPADGKFSVVVQGSPDSLQYPESAGVLGGKVVYTVYLRVGLRKNWILQYALPKDAPGVPGTHGTPIEAPWPLLIMRPDQVSARPISVIVHGKITAAGDFDQIALISPRQFDEQDLLLKSLNLWKFRPARRDGEPAAVEVLLIIPRQD